MTLARANAVSAAAAAADTEHTRDCGGGQPRSTSSSPGSRGGCKGKETEGTRGETCSCPPNVTPLNWTPREQENVWFREVKFKGSTGWFCILTVKLYSHDVWTCIPCGFVPAHRCSAKHTTERGCNEQCITYPALITIDPGTSCMQRNTFLPCLPPKSGTACSNSNGRPHLLQIPPLDTLLPGSLFHSGTNQIWFRTDLIRNSSPLTFGSTLLQSFCWFVYHGKYLRAGICLMSSIMHQAHPWCNHLHLHHHHHLSLTCTPPLIFALCRSHKQKHPLPHMRFKLMIPLAFLCKPFLHRPTYPARLCSTLPVEIDWRVYMIEDGTHIQHGLFLAIRSNQINLASVLWMRTDPRLLRSGSPCQFAMPFASKESLLKLEMAYFASINHSYCSNTSSCNWREVNGG